MYNWKYPVLHHKIAPKSLKCSGCGAVVEQDRVYTKTNSGRYCGSCADSLPTEEEMTQMLRLTSLS